MFLAHEFQKACKGFGQNNIADVLGVSSSSVSQLLKNAARMKMNVFCEICKIIGKHPTDFYPWDKEYK